MGTATPATDLPGICVFIPSEQAPRSSTSSSGQRVVSFFGGGPVLMRTDDPVFADRHCQVIRHVSIREFLVDGRSLIQK